MSALNLRLLGGVLLEQDGVPITGRAAQKRRLALLALLALAPGRTLSRDRLLASLWPEADEEQARHQLSVSVYELRRVLGEHALVSRGDDLELAAAVTTDLDAFEAAVAAGETDTAVALYAGPLLDGFHLSGSSELEHWLDAERHRLARAYAAAMERLAGERTAAGDVAGAAELWRRRAVLDPFNERVALALMQALEQAGDRAGALQHARIHATLLREEFDSPPDREVEQFAARLLAPRESPATAPATPPPPAAAPAPAAPPAPASPEPAPPALPAATAAAAAVAAVRPPVRSHRSAGEVPGPVAERLRRRRMYRRVGFVVPSLMVIGSIVTILLGRDDGGPDRVTAATPPRIAVLPFQDLSLAGSAGGRLGDAIADEIISALSPLDGLDVVARSSSFQFRGEQLAEVGQRLGVSHVLEGSVKIDGGRLKVNAALIDPGNSVALWTESYDRPWHDDSRAGILEVEEEIARAVVSALELRIAGPRAARPLVRVGTRDPAAALSYAEGSEYFHRRTVPDLVRALALFQQAVAQDSTYALAHAGVAQTLTLLGAYDYAERPPAQAYEAARAAANRALAIDQDLPEAYAALGNVHFNYDRDWASAEAAYKKATTLSPNFAEGFHWYSIFLAAQGRHPESSHAIQHAYERSPVSLPTLAGRARNLYFARDYDASIAAYRQLLRHDSTYVTAYIGIGMSLVQAGRPDDAIAAYQRAARLLGGKAPILSALLGHVYALAGRTAEARAELAALEAAAQVRYVPVEYHALIHIGLGEAGAALDALEQAFNNRSGTARAESPTCASSRSSIRSGESPALHPCCGALASNDAG